MQITMHDQIEALKTISGVTLVYCNEPDLDVRTQVGEVPAIAFNIERGQRLITLVMPDEYWTTHPFTPDAAQHITDWFDYMDQNSVNTQTFFYRVSENRFVRLRGSIKIQEEDLPENARLFKEALETVDHIEYVKVRKILDYGLNSEADPELDGLHFYCVIDIKTPQAGEAGEAHINLYRPKSIWNNLEEIENEKRILEEQVQIRITNSQNM